jgi:ATP-dependent helicase/DNAse subunit B
MPITLISGPANAGKTHVVMDAVRGHLAHGEDPLLIVPTVAEVDRSRRELAGEAAVLGARVERFAGLMGEAARRAGLSEPPLGRLAREQVLAALAARHTGGFARALAGFIAELRMRRVTPARLTRALEAWAAADGSGVSAVGRLFEDYQRVLAEIGRVDEEQRATLALDALRKTPALWGRTPVLFVGFDDLTRLQLDAIETLGAVVGARVTVSMTYEPGRAASAGRAGTFQALAPLAAECRALGARGAYYAPAGRAALSHLERWLFEPDAPRMDPDGAVRLLEGATERAELELVALEIEALLAGGMPPGDISVVLRAPGTAADLLQEVFGEASIPHAVQRRRPFGDTGVGRGLIGLLRCVPTRAQEGEGGSAGDLLSWLRAPGLLEHHELADRLEAATRRTGAASAAQARELWEQGHWRLRAIDQLREAADRGPAALLERADRELQWLFGAPRRGRASVLEIDELDDARALAVGRRALAELGELARAAPELVPGNGVALAEVLARLEIASGERFVAEKVAVLDPPALLSAGESRRVRALFVCGLQEGVFPAPERPQPFLAEHDRRRLAETTSLRLGEPTDALQDERYLFYAAVTLPRDLLVLSWHAADEDGAPATRSMFVDDVCDLFGNDLRKRRRDRPRGAAERPADGDRRPADVHAGGLAPLRDEELLAELSAHTWSASSLEVWIGCPVRWLVERMLRAEDLDPDPEPFARGGLAHAALKDTLEGLRARTGSARLAPQTLELARELLQRALSENEADFPLSTMPERRPAVRRRLQADLERYLTHAAELDSPLQPLHLELGFGFAAEQDGLPAVDLGGGVMLRGRIDRIDVGAGDTAVVYDYKGRHAPPAAKWVAQGNLQVALYMHAVEALLGLQAVGGFYQPLSGGDLRARGVLAADGAVAIDCVGGDSREHADVRALLGEATAAAREAAAQAGRGELQARPDTCAFRGGCMYPTICRCERQ